MNQINISNIYGIQKNGKSFLVNGIDPALSDLATNGGWWRYSIDDERNGIILLSCFHKTSGSSHFWIYLKPLIDQRNLLSCFFITEVLQCGQK